jgi:hypothetical protein
MVKLSGPLNSLAASGTINKSLTFQQQQGRQIARLARKPRNPKTGKQRARRAMLLFLAQQWPLLTAEQQDTWQQPAAHQEISRYNAYLGYNLRRWTNHRPPSKTWPASETGSFPVTSAHGASANGKRVELQLNCSLDNDGWAAPWYMIPTVATIPGPEHLVAFADLAGPMTIKVLLKPMPPGTYHFRAKRFTTHGRMDTYLSPTVSCTISP